MLAAQRNFDNDTVLPITLPFAEIANCCCEQPQAIALKTMSKVNDCNEEIFCDS